MITNQDRTAIRKIFRKVKEETDPKVSELARSQSVNREMPNIIAAQNTLRFCLEVVLRECIPYDEYLLAELAARMAAYTVSAAPIERQEQLAEIVSNSINKSLQEKLSRGMALKTEWATDGQVPYPNVPDKSQVQ
ncbi:hypothetical protein MesoLjLc_51930 [Mesorhizobium sp. L-8-10]|uniref:hypothetical protein n=1 Tax=Mesorhizobium sp. L-8-10 TaxID=2744523 RepID=UPI001929035E|nr:hypothetical protein [Mesorhizobium sp. L-8-10]BCH33263.1 hypothetical protein MesoLjLc_51930 [Mesorhizobium sp. L-8-10]